MLLSEQPADWIPLIFLVYPPSFPLKLDVAFVLGGYGPDADAIFERQREFVRTFLDSFRYPITNSQVRVALMQYDKEAKIIKNFTDDYVIAYITKLVNDMTLQRTGARVDLALKEASSSLFTTGRPNASKVLVLFIDAPLADRKSLRSAVQSLAKQGVQLVVVGVGSKARLVDLVAVGNENVIIAETSKTLMHYYYYFYKRILNGKLF